MTRAPDLAGYLVVDQGAPLGRAPIPFFEPGETDPNDPSDDAQSIDTDVDGLSGLSPARARPTSRRGRGRAHGLPKSPGPRG